jgi:polysaccharide deacetylase family protein (PEP-CTERM system associated)
VNDGRFLASFDIEDWFHAATVGPYLPDTNWDVLEGRVERNTHALLDLLGDLNVKATHFVLGWVARRYPALVRRIVDEGHELASHTDCHKLLSKLSPDELTRELVRSRETLEDLAGVRVLGVRAPNFSISEGVLDGIRDAGYWYDSSYFSLRAHERYGRLSASIDPESNVVEVRPGLLELPMSRLRLGRAALPWSGGAYFRIIPYPVYRRGVARRIGAKDWFMFYLHPWELDPDELPPPGAPARVRLRTYSGRGRMRKDLHRLLAEFGSRRIDETLLSLGFTPPAA